MDKIESLSKKISDSKSLLSVLEEKTKIEKKRIEEKKELSKDLREASLLLKGTSSDLKEKKEITNKERKDAIERIKETESFFSFMQSEKKALEELVGAHEEYHSDTE
jgi:hypothetical protein